MNNRSHHDEEREHDHKECVTSAMKIMNNPKCKGYILIAKIEAEGGEDTVAITCRLSKQDLMSLTATLAKFAEEK